MPHCAAGWVQTARIWRPTTTTAAPAGSWRYVHTLEGQAHIFYGSFHEVRPNELIVQTFTYEPFPRRRSAGAAHGGPQTADVG